MPIFAHIVVTLVLASVGIKLGTWMLERRAKTLALPPGPKRLPLIGNILDLPAGGFEAHHWAKHKDAYGARSVIGGRTYK